MTSATVRSMSPRSRTARLLIGAISNPAPLKRKASPRSGIAEPFLEDDTNRLPHPLFHLVPPVLRVHTVHTVPLHFTILPSLSFRDLHKFSGLLQNFFQVLIILSLREFHAAKMLTQDLPTQSENIHKTPVVPCLYRETQNFSAHLVAPNCPTPILAVRFPDCVKGRKS